MSDKPKYALADWLVKMGWGRASADRLTSYVSKMPGASGWDEELAGTIFRWGVKEYWRGFDEGQGHTDVDTYDPNQTGLPWRKENEE